MLTKYQLFYKKRKTNHILKSKTKSLQSCPQKKGIWQKVYTKTPKKPNSAIRKIAKIKLSNNKIIIAYIPGEKHSLKEHNFVLVKGGSVRDLPGVHYKLIRGSLDLAGVLNRKSSKSKYGTKR